MGIIDRLNGKDSLRQAMLDGFNTGYLRGDVAIDAHPESDCWILSDKTRSVAISKDLWDYYQSIADQLPARRVPLETAEPFTNPRKPIERRPRRRSRKRLRELLEQPRLDLASGENKGSMPGLPVGRVIRIGGTPARIMSITQEHVEFVDEEGEPRLVDLEQCRTNFDLRFNKGKDNGCQRIGFRGALDHPPWMSFTDEPPTIFEFLSRDELYQQILEPLAEFGWGTLDVD